MPFNTKTVLTFVMLYSINIRTPKIVTMPADNLHHDIYPYITTLQVVTAITVILFIVCFMSCQKAYPIVQQCLMPHIIPMLIVSGIGSLTSIALVRIIMEYTDPIVLIRFYANPAVLWRYHYIFYSCLDTSSCLQ